MDPTFVTAVPLGFHFSYTFANTRRCEISQMHEIYPNPPVALVALEVRFPEGSIDQPLASSVQKSFREMLGTEWVTELQRVQQFNVELTPGVMPTRDVQQVTVPRFTVRDRTAAVAITNQSLTIETTRYGGYEVFKPTIETVLTAAEEVFVPDGVARIGMRFIDEIRVPGVDRDAPDTWGDWIDESLLGPGAPGHPPDLKLTGLQGVAQFAVGMERTVVLRYGPGFGHAVNSQGPLLRPGAPEPGPFFLLDFDSAWLPSNIPEFSADALGKECDRLHGPIEELFDSFVKPALVEVFRKERVE